jgi:hypothetical protein
MKRSRVKAGIGFCRPVLQPKVAIASDPGGVAEASENYAAAIACGDQNGRAIVGAYGVAYAGRAGTATGGIGAVAVVNDYGVAKAGRFGVARSLDVHDAETGDYGVSVVLERGSARSGKRGISVMNHFKEGTTEHGATAGDEGIAAVRHQGYAKAGKLGIAIAWDARACTDPNDTSDGITDLSGSVSADEGGLLVAFGLDPKTAQRKMVYEPVSSAPGFKCKPRKRYRLEVVDNSLQFVEC